MTQTLTDIQLKAAHALALGHGQHWGIAAPAEHYAGMTPGEIAVACVRACPEHLGHAVGTRLGPFRQAPRVVDGTVVDTDFWGDDWWRVEPSGHVEVVQARETTLAYVRESMRENGLENMPAGELLRSLTWAEVIRVRLAPGGDFEGTINPGRTLPFGSALRALWPRCLPRHLVQMDRSLGALQGLDPYPVDAARAWVEEQRADCTLEKQMELRDAMMDAMGMGWARAGGPDVHAVVAALPLNTVAGLDEAIEALQGWRVEVLEAENENEGA